MIACYTYDETTKRLTAAPKTMIVDGAFVINPKLEHYATIGAYPRGSSAAPTPPEGKIAIPDGFALVNNEWVQQYRFEDDPPPPPRVFVTADLVEALMAEGIWPDVRAWIESQGLLDLVLVTKEFDETNEYFQAGKTALQTELGWTDAEVEELLAQCVMEGE